MVCLSLLYEVNGANSGVACRVLLFRSGVHTTFAAPGKSRRRHQDQCKHQCKDAVVCHHTTGELLKYLHLSFLSNLSTRSSVRGRLAARESVSNNGGESLSRRVSAGAGPSCKMGVCDVDTISESIFPLPRGFIFGRHSASSRSTVGCFRKQNRSNYLNV